jgi:hypothetical protein
MNGMDILEIIQYLREWHAQPYKSHSQNTTGIKIIGNGNFAFYILNYKLQFNAY